MRVLLLGSGGREHALAASLAADPAVVALTCAPGNPGMAALHLTDGSPVPLASVDLADPGAAAALAVELGVDLVVVGPEDPLVAGIADAIRAKGIACFGPSAAAAAIEGSKTFAKDVMTSAGVPTAGSRTCTSMDEVEAAFDQFKAPHVVKDDGLAAGKGVVVTDDRATARAHAVDLITAGHPVVVEQYLAGPEVSLFVITDGTHAMPLLPAQDYKRVGDGDAGPNTGGMGAYTPLPWAPESLVDDVMAKVVAPTLVEMARRGSPFAGLLYVGLAMTADGPKVIEFNCRFGDPETQVVLAMLATPLAGVLMAAANGTLGGEPPLRWREGSAVVVVVASEGYPVRSRTGDPIGGSLRTGVLHAGTAQTEGGPIVSAGGRVLGCVGTGPTLATARDEAYALVAGVELAGSQHRSDIAQRAIDGTITIPA